MNRLFILRVSLFIVIFNIIAISCRAQIEIKSCGINQIIPSFVENSTENDDPILKEKLFLPSIHESRALFEIRLFLDNLYRRTTWIIKCFGDSLTTTRYTILLKSTDMSTQGSSYVRMGEWNAQPGQFVLLNIKTNIKPMHGLSLDSCFKLLIENHLFDIADQPEMRKNIQKAANGVYVPPLLGKGIIMINVKVGNHYRGLSYGDFHLPENQKIQELTYIQNLFELLSQFN